MHKMNKYCVQRHITARPKVSKMIKDRALAIYYKPPVIIRPVLISQVFINNYYF